MQKNVKVQSITCKQLVQDGCPLAVTSREHYKTTAKYLKS